MSNGKKWKMTSKQLHKTTHKKYKHICGGKNEPNPGFKTFRNRKRAKQLINTCDHLGMSKLVATEIRYWV